MMWSLHRWVVCLGCNYKRCTSALFGHGPRELHDADVKFVKFEKLAKFVNVLDAGDRSLLWCCRRSSKLVIASVVEIDLHTFSLVSINWVRIACADICGI